MDSILKCNTIGVWIVFGFIILALSDDCSGAKINDDKDTKGWSSGMSYM